MVPLPLFKLASLFVRHVSKYGANHIKAQAHDHPRFRAFAARYGQSIHQLNMKLNVALLRNPDAERRAKEKAEAPTVRTEEQQKQIDEKHRRDEAKRKQTEADGQKGQAEEPKAQKRSSGSSSSGSNSSSSHGKSQSKQSVWKRKFRPLPENKAVDLFADVIGDAFILTVATGLIVWESWKAYQKPDANKERFDELSRRFDELQKKEDELAGAEAKQRERFKTLEEALRALQDPKRKQSLSPAS